VTCVRGARIRRSLRRPWRPGLGPADGCEAVALAAAARMRRSGVLEAQERWPAAAADLRAVLALEPRHKQVRAVLAIGVKLGQKQQARSFLPMRAIRCRLC